jgi:hypothetical protein
VVIDGAFHQGVTGQPSGCLVCDDRAYLELGHTARHAGFSEGLEIDVNRYRDWTRGAIAACCGQLDQTVGHPGRIRVERARLWIGRNPVSPRPDRRLDDVQVGAGKVGCQPSLQTVQTALDEQATTFPHIPRILCGWRVCPPRSPIQSGIGQPKTLLDQALLGVDGGHLGNCIDLIQGQVASGEALPEYGQILEPTGHPNQKAGR